MTTQRIVDVILGALAAAAPAMIGAASSGSMHLLNIGVRVGERHATLVETLGGGQGALPTQDGMDAVHSHMTNTRNTPVEILERSYPVTIEEYALVQDSPGAGRWRGGAGIRRRYLLNAPATVTLSSDRSRNPPWGLAGGEPGRAAQNYRVLPSGRRAALPSKASWRALAGERLVVETPGGGGYGPPRERDGELISRDRIGELLSDGYVDHYYEERETDQS